MNLRFLISALNEENAHSYVEEIYYVNLQQQKQKQTNKGQDWKSSNIAVWVEGTMWTFDMGFKGPHPYRGCTFLKAQNIMTPIFAML